MAPYPTLKVVKALLKEHGLSPRKRMGQNFLIEGNIARKSLLLAKIQADDQVVEIGPGLGALTQLLLESKCEVYAIEKDRGLFNYLKTTFSEQINERLHLIQGDAMEHPLGSFAEPTGEFKIVANLPYAISTPWLDAILSGPLPSRMVLMLQKETASRYVAESGSGHYGPISIFLKSAYKVEATHPVTAQCFHPKPEVGSVLLSLKRKTRPLLFSRKTKDGIRQIFRQRRKQIGTIITKETLGQPFENWLENLIAQGHTSTMRPEAIGEEQWQLLAGD